jgi:hypothetical protein
LHAASACMGVDDAMRRFSIDRIPEAC